MLAFAIALLGLVAAQVSPSCTLSNKLAKSSVPDARYCPYVWATGLATPRGVEISQANELLVVESGLGRVTALWDDNKDGKSDSSERITLATQSGLNHGIVVDVQNGYLYASTPTDVYRWPYTAGTRKNLGTGQHVLTGIPCCHHVTRTLRISPNNQYLYVQSGSGNNVDPDPSHSQIRRFPISSLGATVVNWSTGELIANGLRNEVGVRFDPFGRLWGVENGVDDLYRADLGGDIHNDNPCEELNLLQDDSNGLKGAFYGYPYCWSEYILAAGKGAGTQWLQPDFTGQGVWTDAWCQSLTNVAPPKFCFPAHNAPLDILFGSITNSTSSKFMGYVSFHGSWDRTPADGYNVRQINFDSNDKVTNMTLLAYEGPGATGAGWIRPVGLGMLTTPYGTSLMISDDSNGQLIGLSYI